ARGVALGGEAVVVAVTVVAGDPPIGARHILGDRKSVVYGVAVDRGAAGAGRGAAAGSVIRPVDAEADRPRRIGPATERGRVLDRPAGRLRGRGAGGHRRRRLVHRRGLARGVALGGEAVVVAVTVVAGDPPIGARHILGHRTRRVAAVATHRGAAGAGRRAAAGRVVVPVDAEAVRTRRIGPATECGRVLNGPAGRLRGRGAGGHRRRRLVHRRRRRRGIVGLVAVGGRRAHRGRVGNGASLRRRHC